MNEKEIWLQVYLTHIHRDNGHDSAVKAADAVITRMATLNK